MAKSGKARSRTTHRGHSGDVHAQNTAISNDLQERLKRIEAKRTNDSTSSSQVFKFAFFFLMGVVLTATLYPEISRAIGSSIQDEKTTVETTVESATSNSTKRQHKREYFSEFDTDQFETIDDTRHSTNIDTNPHNPEPVRERLNAVADEDVTDITMNGESQKETQKERMILKTIDSSDLMMDEEIHTQDNGHETHAQNGNSQLEKNKDGSINEQYVKSKNDNSLKHNSDKDKRPVKQNKETQPAQHMKLKRTKTELNRDTNKNEDEVPTANDKKLPKEIRNFKPTILAGVTAKKIFADGRRIPPVELLPQKPNNSSVRVWMFDEFLSDAECDGLMRVHDQHVTDQNKLHPILCFDSVSTLRKHLRSVGKKTLVTPRDFTPGTTCVNTTFSRQLREWLHGNWSYSTAFYSGESRFAGIFEHRVKEATGLTPENGGKFQITSYPEGIGYKSHTDCTEDSTDKRDRVATVMVYLDTVEDGGRTEFPELGIWVKPRKGRAMVWNNMNEAGECEPMSIHKAAKVVSGQKYILLRWYYYQSFYSLGKRPPEPHLPQRESGQPRVACDEYEHGSCRWYDEWNFDHMVDYEKQKYTLV